MLFNANHFFRQKICIYSMSCGKYAIILTGFTWSVQSDPQFTPQASTGPLKCQKSRKWGDEPIPKQLFRLRTVKWKAFF